MPLHYVSGVEIELLASSSTIQDPNETETPYEQETHRCVLIGWIAIGI